MSDQDHAALVERIHNLEQRMRAWEDDISQSRVTMILSLYADLDDRHRGLVQRIMNAKTPEPEETKH
jgi:hypothetical protein